MNPPRTVGTVGVGVGVLVVREGKVLLGKRKGSHGAGTWSAPGGKLEYGESIEQCAARELREETSLEIGPVEPGPYTNDLFTEMAEQYLTVFVVAKRSRDEPVTLEVHKCEGWLWFEWSKLPEPLFPPIRSLVASGFVPQ